MPSNLWLHVAVISNVSFLNLMTVNEAKVPLGAIFTIVGIELFNLQTGFFANAIMYLETKQQCLAICGYIRVISSVFFFDVMSINETKNAFTWFFLFTFRVSA